MSDPKPPLKKEHKEVITILPFAIMVSHLDKRLSKEFLRRNPETKLMIHQAEKVLKELGWDD